MSAVSGCGVDEDFDVLQPGREAFDVFRNGEVRAFYFRTQAGKAVCVPTALEQ